MRRVFVHTVAPTKFSYKIDAVNLIPASFELIIIFMPISAIKIIIIEGL